MRRPLLALIAPAAVAAVLAGCGGGSYHATASTTAAKTGPSTASGAGATVAARHTGLGTVLVDGKGRTLYLFEKDTGGTSTCSGACASLWPPLSSTGTPAAGAGVTAAELGATKSPTGGTEVTYAGHPLYTYAGDTAPGDTQGEGLDSFGAEWYVLAPSGRKVEKT